MRKSAVNGLSAITGRIVRQRSAAAAAIILTAVQCGMELWLPRLMAFAVDEGILGGKPEQINAVGWKMLAVCLVMGLAGYGANILCAFIGQRLALELRGELYGRISSMSVRQVTELGSGSLITRLTTDVDICANYVNALLLLVFEPVLLTVGGVMMMWMISPSLGLVLIAFTALLLIIMTVFIRNTAPGFRKLRLVTDRINARLQNVLGLLRTVKGAGNEQREKARFAESNRMLYDAGFAVQRKIAVFNPLVMLIMNLAVAAVLYSAGAEVANHSIRVGAVLSAITYAEQILVAITAGGRMFKMIAETQPSADRLIQVLETEPEMPADGETLGEAFRELRFDRVSFGYEEGSSVLREISLSVERGETLAVIGPVGCGKSTVAMLCARLADVSGGRVLINEKDIRKLSMSELRRTVALTEKNSAILEGSIRDNIVFGRSGITDDEIRQAVSVSQLEELLEKKPKGLETRLYSMGKSLSGGERQRVTIARALAGRPGLLILDDSTSALDYITEERLLKQIRETYPEMAVLLMTNRLRSAESADRILVLGRDGSPAGEGKADTLRSSCAYYQRMLAVRDGRM
ncbi:MAG: ABC transporter ATP-binding protein/permease [Oscillospiraceae bacterium]|nr:ABC transporter ATP-binding protein/permease [Oscillospiraceae bacterium]